MFAINTRVASRIALNHGDMVTGTVRGIEYVCRDTGDAIVMVEWDADSWSEWRERDSVWSDELVDVLAV